MRISPTKFISLLFLVLSVFYLYTAYNIQVFAFDENAPLHTQIHNERVAALSKFKGEVLAGNFPYANTNISMKKGEKNKFFEALDKWKPIHQ